MLFSPASPNPPQRIGLILSAAGHAGLFLLVVVATLHFGRVRPIVRSSRCCSAILRWNTTPALIAPVSGTTPAAARPAPRVPRARPARRRPIPAPKPMASTTPPATNPQQQPTRTPGDGTGSDDAEPAFPTYFPRPAVADRSLLPAVEQKVIVTVSISAVGDVTDETLTQGVGNSLDQIVLDTVKTWRFHPASLNGTAVASTEQLVFPFNRSSNSSGASDTPG